MFITDQSIEISGKFIGGARRVEAPPLTILAKYGILYKDTNYLAIYEQ